MVFGRLFGVTQERAIDPGITQGQRFAINPDGAVLQWPDQFFGRVHQCEQIAAMVPAHPIGGGNEDFKRGNIYRYVTNAEAIARIKVGDVTQDWSRQRLQGQFDNLKFDNGPHSETRVVLRYRLWQDAKGQDAERKKGAIMTLKFMKERGVLMALRGEQGDTGEMAKRAFFELMNPKAIMAEDLKGLQTKGDGRGDKQ